MEKQLENLINKPETHEVNELLYTLTKNDYKSEISIYTTLGNLTNTRSLGIVSKNDLI